MGGIQYKTAFIIECELVNSGNKWLIQEERSE